MISPRFPQSPLTLSYGAGWRWLSGLGGALSLALAIALIAGEPDATVPAVYMGIVGVGGLLIAYWWSHRFIIDEEGIVRIGPFGRRDVVAWSDIDRATLVNGRVRLIDRRGVVVMKLSSSLRPFDQFVRGLAVAQHSGVARPPASSFSAPSAWRVWLILGSPFFLGGVLVVASDPADATGYVLPAIGLLFLLGVVFQSYRLTIDDDTIRISSLMRSRSYGRDDIVGVRWVDVEGKYGTSYTHLVLRLRNSDDEKIGFYGDAFEIYDAVRRWRREE